MSLADFSLGDLVISMVSLFFLVIFFFLLISILTDLFRSDDLSGGAKALWVIVLVILPFLGALIYMVSRGSGMGERALAAAHKQQAQVEEAATMIVGGMTPADELQTLAGLKERGHLSDEEFERLKAKVLG